MEFISSALSSMHVLSMFASHDKDLNGFLHVHQWMSSISVISLEYPFASTLRRSLNPELRRFIRNRCKTSTHNSFLCYNVIVLIAIFTMFYLRRTILHKDRINEIFFRYVKQFFNKVLINGYVIRLSTFSGNK